MGTEKSTKYSSEKVGGEEEPGNVDEFNSRKSRAIRNQRREEMESYNTQSDHMSKLIDHDYQRNDSSPRKSCLKKA